MHVYVLSACLCDSGNSRKAYYKVDLEQLLSRTVLTDLCVHDLNNYVFFTVRVRHEKRPSPRTEIILYMFPAPQFQC